MTRHKHFKRVFHFKIVFSWWKWKIGYILTHLATSFEISFQNNGKCHFRLHSGLCSTHLLQIIQWQNPWRNSPNRMGKWRTPFRESFIKISNFSIFCCNSWIKSKSYKSLIVFVFEFFFRFIFLFINLKTKSILLRFWYRVETLSSKREYIQNSIDVLSLWIQRFSCGVSNLVQRKTKCSDKRKSQ